MPKLLTLRKLCVVYCMNNIDLLLALEPKNEGLDENEEETIPRLQFELPADICDSLLDFHFHSTGHIKDQFLRLFKDYHRTNLSRISLQRMKGQTIEPWMLGVFCRHPVTLLEIPIPYGRPAEDSQAFTFQNLFEPLQNVKSSLKVLALHIDYSKDNRINIMDEWIYRCILVEEQGSEGLDPTLEFPNLFSLTLKNFYFNIVDPEFSELFAKTLPFNIESEDEKAVQMQKFFEKVKIFKNLAHLNLTGCYLQNDCYFFLERCTKLTSLVLTDIHDGLMNDHDTEDEGFMILMQTVVRIKTLRHLDVSSNFSEEAISLSNIETRRTSSGEFLTWILSELPNLISLELANTNLADCLLKLPNETEESYKSRYPLIFNRHFDYLGLWGSGVFEFRDVDYSFPSELLQVKKLAGWETREQILVALRVYSSRPPIMKNVLRHLYGHLQKSQSLDRREEVIKDILNHLRGINGDQYGWICLFLLLQSYLKDETEIDQVIRIEVLQLIVTVLEGTNDSDIIKLCLHSAVLLETPYDVLCCYMFDRFTKCLLEKLVQSKDISPNEKFLLGLLHSICRADFREKKAAVELGLLEHLYTVIQNRLTRKQCDICLERAWSCLWSLTDEMPENCRIIMTDEKVIEMFFGCAKAFEDKAGLMRKLTGLMANISEVQDLRPLLMTDAFISFLVKLLKPADEIDIDVSYHSAGILSEIAADGPEKWTVESHPRSDVLSKILHIVLSWDINVPRKIKYRSLCPLLRMCQCYDVPESQLWATWAICNLIKVKSERYIPMLIREKGVGILQNVTKEERCLQKSQDLATMGLQEIGLVTRNLYMCEVSTPYH